MKNKLFTIATIACLLVFLVSCSCHSDKSEPIKKIAVTGSAEMEIVPDEIYVSFTLQEYMKGAKKVKLEGIKDEFLKQCKDAGIADSCVSISSYTGNERWDYYWYRRRKTEPDFKNSITYDIKVSTPDKLDKLVSSMNEDAIQNFYLKKTSHSKIEQLRKETKINALVASKDKADYLAKSIGEKLGEAILIQETESPQNYYYPYANAASNVVSQSAISYIDDNTTTNFQKIKLRYEMHVEFKLK